MSNHKAHNPLKLTVELYQYALDHSLRELDIARRLREETDTLGRIARMQAAPDEGQFLSLLLRLMGGKKVIEVGVFTGYTTLVLAHSLKGVDGARIIALDINDEWTSIGKKYWQEAGVEELIDLRLKPATESLQQLLDDGQAGTFDLVFIDADKTGYDNYYELGLKLLRQNGLIVIDNTLWGGRVLDQNDQTEDTNAIRALNAKISKDERIDVTLLPFADGVTLCRKK